MRNISHKTFENWGSEFFDDGNYGKKIVTRQISELNYLPLKLVEKMLDRKYIAEIILDQMNPKNIIDIGCGSNLFAESTAKNYKCIGVDFAGNYDLYGNICMGLPEVRDKEFDLVTCYDVLEHLLPSCIDGAIKEMNRISRKFIFKIDYKPSINKVYDSPMHQTVKPKNWWMGKIKEYSNNVQEKLGYIYGDWN